MAANEYVFVTHWRLKGSIDRIFQMVSDGMGYPRWWSQVYLKAEQVAPGDANRIGQTVRFLSKGKLPYTISWTSRRTEFDPIKRRVVFRAEGDFDGWAIWSVEQQGDEVVATLDWRLKAEKPLLRILSPVLKPLFRANHHWCMDRGLESLRRELAE